jgi:hypothetical protein
LAPPKGQLNSLGSLTEGNFGEWASLDYTTRSREKFCVGKAGVAGHQRYRVRS